MPKHPEINVELVGQDGNAFSILGRVTYAMRRGGLSEQEIEQFREETTSGDYDHLLITVMDWVETDNDDDDEDDEDDEILEEWDDECYDDWLDKEYEKGQDEVES